MVLLLFSACAKNAEQLAFENQIEIPTLESQAEQSKVTVEDEKAIKWFKH